MGVIGVYNFSWDMACASLFQAERKSCLPSREAVKCEKRSLRIFIFFLFNFMYVCIYLYIHVCSST